MLMKTILALFFFAATLAGEASPLQTATLFATVQQRGSDITSFVKRKYPGARILDRDYDDGRIEVEMRHQGFKKTACFTHGGRWLCTVWELRRERLPKAVVSAVARQGFPFRTIDDNDCKAVEDGRGLRYAVIVERGDDDRVFIVTERGKIEHTFYDDDLDDILRYRFYDDGEDHFDEGDDEWNDRRHRPVYRRGHDDGEDRFDEGDDEWDDGED